MASYHVSVAAEAFAAALFARAGYSVSIQYGANQPGYDLIVAGDGMPKKVSVKGTNKRGWVLTASKKKGKSYHGAIDAWTASLKDPEILHCLVQFKGVDFETMPRLYLARTCEVAAYLKSMRAGHGYTVLRENHKWIRGPGAGTTDSIPEEWKMRKDRIAKLLGSPST